MSKPELWLPPTARLEHRKAAPPKLGESFGHWAGQDMSYLTLPGGGVLQFDLSRLTLADFRAMRDHYQINSSLTSLTFMVHQLDWDIECEDKKIRDFVTEVMRPVWTRLVRALSQAFWAGYSPIVPQWENDVEGRRIVVTKFKDLVPEHCRVNWKTVEGWAPPGELPPKYKVYNGIKQDGLRHPIPVENTLWWPLLMENGDYYGKKLLRPAFPSWFFSILLHLFANRYYERFGEPTPIGRADFEQDVEVDGKEMKGNQAMEVILRSLRNRSTVILPSDRVSTGDSTKSEYAFDIEYLESQMRGADFERYISRLDEEISLSLFTPLLLLRTADVGSYNLGVSHMQMYLWMLNALAGDMKEYIDKFVLARLVDFNFGPRAPRATWEPRKLGKDNVEMIKSILQSVVTSGRGEVDLEELSAIAGITVRKAKELVDPSTDPNADDSTTEPAKPDTRVRVRPERKRSGLRGVGEPRATGKKISARLAGQITRAFDKNEFSSDKFKPSLGYRQAFEDALRKEGADSDTAYELAEALYRKMDMWFADIVGMGSSAFSSAAEVIEMFDTTLDWEIKALAT